MTYTEEAFVDPRDQEPYGTVRLRDGNIWFCDDLRFKAPDSVPAQDYSAAFSRLSTSEFYPPFDPKKRGRLYSWENARVACPRGWRLPKAEEWSRLLSLYDNSLEALQRDGFSLRPSGFVESPKGSLIYGHYRSCLEALYWTDTQMTKGILFKRPDPTGAYMAKIGGLRMFVTSETSRIWCRFDA